MDISVIIPLYNEEESLPELHAWICRVMDANHFSYEIIFVNDGSTDKSWEVIQHLSKEDKKMYEALSSVETMEKVLHFSVVLKLHKAMLL